MEQTKITGFIIHAEGDPSVGIFGAEWRLVGDFWFDSPIELEEFRGELKTLFDGYADPIWIETFEEQKAQAQINERLLQEDESKYEREEEYRRSRPSTTNLPEQEINS